MNVFFYQMNTEDFFSNVLLGDVCPGLLWRTYVGQADVITADILRVKQTY